MTEPEATPEQQAHVRRLLAGARHEGPVPPEVAARLDDVLAALVAEGPGSVDPPPPPPAAPVLDLAARRRRRAGGLLLAAAAVVVAGVGLGQVVGKTGGSSDDSSSTAGDASAEVADAPREAGPDDADGAALAPSAIPPGADADPELPGPSAEEDRSPVPRLTTSDFADRAAQLQRRPGYLVTDAETLVTSPELAQDPMYVCEGGGFGTGRLLGVLYNGQPAVLAFRPPMGETQAADLLQCGSGRLLRSITLPTLR